MKIPISLYKSVNNNEKNEKPDNMLKKEIRILDFFSLNEANMSQYIRQQIPKYSNHFRPIQSHKVIRSIDQSINPTKYILMYTPQYNKPVTVSEFFSQNSSNQKKQLYFLVQSFNHLLDTCNIMQTNKIVHFNICTDTIFFKQNTPILYNFTHSFHWETLDEERKSNLFCKYYPGLIHWAPPAHILCYIRQNNLKSLSTGTIERIFEDYVKCLMKYVDISEDFAGEFKQAWVFSLQKLINKPIQEISNEILKMSCLWDGYSVCILYLQLIAFLITIHKKLAESIFIQNFIDILKKNLCAVSISEMKISFENVLANIKRTDFIFFLF